MPILVLRRTPCDLMQGAERKIAVIGAGVVGLCSALYLQRSGHKVTVIDSLDAGASASYGNSGMLSVDDSAPMAMPGMLRNVPKWLMDPLGPLYVDPRYFPTALPWLMKWLRASRMSVVRQSASALHELHKPAIPAFRELLGEMAFADLTRSLGQIYLWDTPYTSRTERISAALRETQDAEAQSLNTAELRDLVPGITPTITRAILMPRNGSVVNPRRMMQTLERLIVEAGGDFLRERVLGLYPEDDNFRVMTNCSDLSFKNVVVAAGAWSKSLIAPLGLKVPLETERGYHMQLSGDTARLRIPLLFRSRGFSAAPMEMGLRLSGTVEIAGLERPPNRRRGEALLKQGKLLFPDLNYEECKMWMGFRPSLPDSLPIIDRSPHHKGLFLCFGHGHLGLTEGAISGKLVTELINGTPSTVDLTPYRISRFIN